MDPFQQLLVVVLGFVLFTAGSAVVIWLIASIDRAECMSDAWRRQNKQAEVRAVGRVEHELVIDGHVVLRHADEDTVHAVRREIERLK
jgi:hypothetical protein